MRRNFLEYASYSILDRAIPDLRDGCKPVQRRILHTLFEMNDGSFHKVANVIGETMKLHPHGDASIGDALVVLANKGYFIERQGNFGNPLTGHPAAAARYIECRLTPLALETLFSRDLTEFEPSYRRPQARAGLAAGADPGGAHARGRGHRGRPVDADPPALLPRAAPGAGEDPAGKALEAPARLSPGRPDGRLGVRPGSRQGARARADRAAGRQEGRDHRGALRHHHREPDRVDRGRRPEGARQDQRHRRLHHGPRRDRALAVPGRLRRRGHPAALRLHRLRGVAELQLDRDPRRPSGRDHRPRGPGAADRPAPRDPAPRAPDRARASPGPPALADSGADLHREEGLQEARDRQDRRGRRPRGLERDEAAREALRPGDDRRRRAAAARDPHPPHLRLRHLAQPRRPRPDREGHPRRALQAAQHDPDHDRLSRGADRAPRKELARGAPRSRRSSRSTRRRWPDRT